MMTQLDARTSLLSDPTGAGRGVLVEKQRSNVYTVMLVVSLLAICFSCFCLWRELDMYQWDFKAQGAKVPPAPVAAVAPELAPANP